VHYHDGVGAEGDLFKKLLGGAIGLGLKQIIRECYDFVVKDIQWATRFTSSGSRAVPMRRAL
jgi:hypothetical protein